MQRQSNLSSLPPEVNDQIFANTPQAWFKVLQNLNTSNDTWFDAFRRLNSYARNSGDPRGTEMVTAMLYDSSRALFLYLSNISVGYNEDTFKKYDARFYNLIWNSVLPADMKETLNVEYKAYHKRQFDIDMSL
jgi:hypothetical protein